MMSIILTYLLSYDSVKLVNNKTQKGVKKYFFLMTGSKILSGAIAGYGAGKNNRVAAKSGFGRSG